MGAGGLCAGGTIHRGGRPSRGGKIGREAGRATEAMVGAGGGGRKGQGSRGRHGPASPGGGAGSPRRGSGLRCILRVVRPAYTGPELSQWVRWASEGGRVPVIVCTVANAALIACLTTRCSGRCWER
jgi:hypothetical protein